MLAIRHLLDLFKLDEKTVFLQHAESGIYSSMKNLAFLSLPVADHHKRAFARSNSGVKV